MKNVFITGAASGIGLATAKMLFARGYHLGLGDLNLAALQEVTNQWLGDQDASRVSCYQLDVTDYDTVSQVLGEFATNHAGQIDGMINNAGVLNIDWFATTPIERHKLTVDVNVNGVINGCYAAYDHLKPAQAPVVVNLCSASAIYGTPEFATYSASKFAVKGLTEALELEWQRDGIKVCCVLPPFVATPMVNKQQHVPGTIKSLGVSLTPEDVAEVVCKQLEKPKLYRPVSSSFTVLFTLTNILPTFLVRAFMKHIAKLG